MNCTRVKTLENPFRSLRTLSPHAVCNHDAGAASVLKTFAYDRNIWVSRHMVPIVAYGLIALLLARPWGMWYTFYKG